MAGAGIGRAHVQAYLDLAARFEVALVCDLDPARAAEVAALAGCESCPDYRAALLRADVDVLDVCLPPHLHCEATLAALAAGKHVVCEKPLATSLAEADRMLAAAAAAGRVLAPVFQYRYGTGFRTLLHLVRSGFAGRALVATLETHWDRGADYYAVPWRGTWAGEHGGAILGHAIHAHDLLCTALGAVRRVFALTATRVNPVEVEDCAALVFETASGALVTSSVTLGAAGNLSRLRMCFEHFSAESGLAPYHPGGEGWTFTARDPARQAELDRASKEAAAVAPGFAGLLAELALALDGRPAELVSAAEARGSIELATAIYRSARSGAAVTLPLGVSDADYEGWAPRPAHGVTA